MNDAINELSPENLRRFKYEVRDMLPTGLKYLITYEDLKECGVNVSNIHIVPNLDGNCKL